VAGGVFSLWISPLISRVEIPHVPSLPPLSLMLDVRLALYMLALVILTALLCGMIPARQATRLEILPNLKHSRIEAGGHMRRLLVGGQVAVSALLLVLCVLFLRSLLYVNRLRPGFDIDHLVTAKIMPQNASIASVRIHALAEEFRQRMSVVAGIEAVTYASMVPLSGDSYMGSIHVRGEPDVSRRLAHFSNVGPDYFRSMGTQLLQGREFASHDRLGSPPVAIINDSFARLYLGNAQPLGKLVRLGTEGPWREIIGVAADSKYGFYAEGPTPQLFAPFLQTQDQLYLQIRTAAPSAAAGAIRRVIAETDQTLAADVRPTRDFAALEPALRRLSTAMLAIMGGLGAGLAMIGLYGVMAFDVGRRRAEIGLRLALGATPSRIARLVVRNCLRTALAGTVAGIAAAMIMAIPLRVFLAGVRVTDPLSLLSVGALLMATSLAASALPLLRALRIDPIEALRQE
jgi:predicted permease